MKDYKLVLVVGQTGTGKTTWIKNLLKQYNYLVLDPVGAWQLRELKTLDEVKNWPYNYRAKITKLLFESEVEVIKIIQNKPKIHLIIDDADTFIFYRNKIIYNPFFYGYRHLKQNIFVICHSFNDVPQSVLRTSDYIVVFPHISKLDIKGGEKFNPIIYDKNTFLRLI